MTAVPDKIETIVTIQTVLSPRTCHATLPNGKVIFGFTAKDASALPLHAGKRMRVMMSVADFSRGEMVGLA